MGCLTDVHCEQDKMHQQLLPPAAMSPSFHCKEDAHLKNVGPDSPFAAKLLALSRDSPGSLYA